MDPHIAQAAQVGCEEFYGDEDLDDFDVEEDEDPEVQWLCGCGHGNLRIRVSAIPELCPVCETPTAL
jgi:hypothetical protein